MTRRQAESTEVERDRLREALAWAMCEVAGQLGEQALLVAEQLFDLGASQGMRFQKEEAQHGQA